MASDLSFVDYIIEQMGHPGALSFKKMFGEYAIYYDNKVIALVCDNQLYLKPTLTGKQMIGEVEEASPYPGAKPYFHVTHYIDDQEWLQELVLLTAKELPQLKLKKPKAKMN
jgi:TfoX/Sxy family transcriptional regulator of competence genes